MPRFVFDTVTVSGAQLDAAVRLAQLQFPEIAIESLAAAPDTEPDDGRVRWVCHAPSRSHVDRWVASAGLPADALPPTDTKGKA